MISIPKIIGVISCSAVLCLSLSSTTQATERMGHDPCADRKGGLPNLVKCDEKMRKGIQTSKAEALRIEGGNYLIERIDGKEVWGLRVAGAGDRN